MNLKEIIAATTAEPTSRPTGHALVVLSGGQDSVTCLAWALRVFPEGVSAVTFAYGQKHSVEIDCAIAVCDEHLIPHHIISLAHIDAVSKSALLASNGGDVASSHDLNKDLPASFVPNRNAMMLTAAHALAQTIGAKHVVAGMCQTDYSGYPDCREDFIVALSNALNLGAAKAVNIHTPLMHLTKAETFALAEACDALHEVVENSHTCYNGVRSIKHAWGYGCGTCPACQLRAKGWDEYKAGAL